MESKVFALTGIMCAIWMFLGEFMLAGITLVIGLWVLSGNKSERG